MFIRQHLAASSTDNYDTCSLTLPICICKSLKIDHQHPRIFEHHICDISFQLHVKAVLKYEVFNFYFSSLETLCFSCQVEFCEL